MYFIILITAVFSQNTYNVHVFNKAGNNTNKYPELYPIRNIFNSISRSIKLKDGRIVSCQIPLNLVTQPLKLDTQATNLTDSQVQDYLFPLEDLCVQYRTFDFLYEYCFRKYVRQYDDTQTVINGKKKFKESFFLGFSDNYNQKYNETNGIRSPQFDTYKLDHPLNELIENTSSSFVIIDGCVAKIRNAEIDLQRNQAYILAITTETQTYKINIVAIVHSELLIIEQCQSELIVTDYFEINQVNGIITETKKNYIYSYRNVLFGINLQAHDNFFKLQTLGIIYSSSVHLVTVQKIYDIAAIEVEGLKSSKIKKIKLFPQRIQKLILFDGTNIHQKLFDDVVISGNVVLFNEIEEINENDDIVIVDSSVAQLEYAESYKIVKVQEQVAYLQQSLTKNLDHKGVAFIRKHDLFNHPQNYSTVSNKISQEDQKRLEQVTLIVFKHFRNDFIKSVPYKPYIAISFLLQTIKVPENPQLHILLNSQQYGLCRISFLSQPIQSIYVKNLNQEGDYAQMEQRFHNQTIFGHRYWIFVDTNNDYLHIGRGEYINLGNQMIKFKLMRKIQIDTDMEFRFEKSTTDIKIKDLVDLPLYHYRAYQYMDDEYYHVLNYTYPEKENGIFIEQYNNGSYCQPLDGPRNSEVILQCNPHTLLKFQSVTEPKICHYKIIIGTNILCEQSQLTRYENEPMEQHVMCTMPN